MKATVKVTERTERRTTLEFAPEQLLRALGAPTDVPVRIYVRVPGGGDWSNTDLEIDDETPLVLSWTRIEITEDA